MILLIPYKSITYILLTVNITQNNHLKLEDYPLLIKGLSVASWAFKQTLPFSDGDLKNGRSQKPVKPSAAHDSA